MIHPTAIVHKTSNIHPSTEIGPFSIIHKNVEIGENCKIHSQVEIFSNTQIADSNEFYKGSVIGGGPQDKSFKKSDVDEVKLKIGKNNIFREYTTVHHGTESVTQIGDDNYFMAYSHIAHDSKVHNNTTIANYTALAGWVEVRDYAFLSGHVLVHQHCRIGEYAMIGGLCRINQDIAPFSLIAQENGKIVGINKVGLKRGGYPYDKIKKIQNIYNALTKRKGYAQKTLDLSIIEKAGIENETALIIKFFEESKKGVVIKWLKG